MIESHKYTVYSGRCSCCRVPFDNEMRYSSLEKLQEAARHHGWLIRWSDDWPPKLMIYCSAKCREEHMVAMAEMAYEGE